MKFSDLVDGICIFRIELQLFLKLRHRTRQIFRACLFSQASSDPIVNPMTLRIKRQDPAIRSNRFTQRTLTLVRFRLSLLLPNGVWRHRRQLLNRKIGEVPEDALIVIQHFGIGGEESLQLQRHLHRIAVLPQRRVHAFEL